MKAAGGRTGRGFPWIAGAVLLQSTATVFSKYAGLASRGGGALQLVWNPWYGAAIIALALQAGCWVTALRRLPVSLAYPVMSLVFPLNLLAARLLFAEEVRSLHAIGIVLIVCGIWMLARPAQRGARP